ELVSVTTSQGTYSGTNNVVVDLGTLANGASATVAITTMVIAPGSVNNNLQASANEPDPTPNNNTVTSPVVAMADTTTTVSTSGSPAAFGQSITFTAAVRSIAPATAIPS